MKLKDYLKEKDITEDFFAASIGVSQVHVNYITRGKRNPSIELSRIIEKATDGKVTVYDLFNPEAPSRLKSRNKRKKENGNIHK